MKTLLEIQNEVAKEFGYEQWHDNVANHLWPEVCRRAQLECARETLKEASEKAIIRSDWNHAHHEGTPYIDKNSILDEANIKLIQ